MSDRLTAAGEALLRRLTTRGTQDNRPFEAAIRAIEAEAAARAVDEALEHIPQVWQGIEDPDIAWLGCSCGWDSDVGKNGWVEHLAAALVAHLRGPR